MLVLLKNVCLYSFIFLITHWEEQTVGREMVNFKDQCPIPLIIQIKKFTLIKIGVLLLNKQP